MLAYIYFKIFTNRFSPNRFSPNKLSTNQSLKKKNYTLTKMLKKVTSLLPPIHSPFGSKRSSKPTNEAMFGPLQLTGEFCYNVFKNSEIDERTVRQVETYILSIEDECNISIPINKLLTTSIFTRVVKLDLGYMHPVIGLITISADNNVYEITHISVHKMFRNQGLAKLLLFSFVSYLDQMNNISNNPINTVDDVSVDVYEESHENKFITCIIPRLNGQNTETAHTFFDRLKFNEVIEGTNTHMIRTISGFIELTKTNEINEVLL